MPLDPGNTNSELPPTLQLPTPPSTAICSSCAQSPSFTCLWCSSSDELAAQKGDVQPATLTQKLAPSSVDIAAGLAAASTTLSKGQVRGRASSHQPQASQSIPSRLTLDLRDETPLFGPFSTSLLQEETLNRKDGAILNETPLITPTLEGNDVAMIRPPSLEAGSSTTTANSEFSSGTRSRSRSLFSLTITSRSANTQSTTPPTTSPMISVARSISRRLSSTTSLRHATETSDAFLAKPSLNDDDDTTDTDAFNPHSKDGLLHRKTRGLDSPAGPDLQTATGGPLALRKVSKSSLHVQPPIAISLRPGSSDSATSSSNRDPSPRQEERDLAPEQQPTTSPTRTVRWSVDEKHDSTPAAAAATTRSPTAPPLPPLPPVPPPGNLISPPPSAVGSAKKVGTPSRPYYSAIRKHCMSSPARPSSDGNGEGPPSMSLPLIRVSRSRPTSTSVPPSAFGMASPSVTPFTRRPVSVGALPPSGSPRTSTSGPSALVAGGTSSTSAVPAGRTSMSVFDVTDDDGVDVEEETRALQLAAAMDKQQDKRKSSSLSRAFGRSVSGQQPGGIRKRWSGTLFASPGGSTTGGLVGSDGKLSAPGNAHEHLHNGTMDRMGISMSGETELRMALAAMQEQDAAADASRSRPTDEGVGAQKERDNSRERTYRFRRTFELSPEERNNVALPSSSAGAQAPGKEREGRSPAKSRSPGLIKKLKKGLKGMLGPSKPSGNL